MEAIVFIILKYFGKVRSFENCGICNNYSTRKRWLAMDIIGYCGKYPKLATDTEVNSCFSIIKIINN